MKTILIVIISFCSAALAADLPNIDLKVSQSNASMPEAETNSPNHFLDIGEGIELPKVMTNNPVSMPNIEDLKLNALDDKSPEVHSVVETTPAPVVETTAVVETHEQVSQSVKVGSPLPAPVEKLADEPLPVVKSAVSVKLKVTEPLPPPPAKKYEDKDVLEHAKKRSHKGGRKTYVDEEFTASEFSLLAEEDDDVVLGKLTEAAYVENLDAGDYLELVEMHYISPEEMKKSEAIKKYLDNYGKFYLPTRPL